MNVRRTLATLALTALALGMGATHASADTLTHGPTKADKRAAQQASALCADITDDVTWEACVTGQVQVDRTAYTFKHGRPVSVQARALTADDYESGSTLHLTGPTHAVGHKAHQPTKADKRALKSALAQCTGLWDADVPVWVPCVWGAFTMDTGRVITDMDVSIDEVPDHGGEGVSGMTMHLTGGSHHILP